MSCPPQFESQPDGQLVPGGPPPRHPFQFSLRTLLLLFIPAALLSALAARILRPPPVNVTITVDQFSWYDDRGHRCLEAMVRITNVSGSTVWFLGAPTYYFCQTVDGKTDGGQASAGPDRWNVLRSGESIRIPVGPVSERATEIRVGVPFTTDWFVSKAHWVYCPVVKVVKKGHGYFPEVKKGAKQEERVLPLPLLP